MDDTLPLDSYMRNKVVKEMPGSKEEHGILVTGQMW